jgi:hypothetical protein
MSAMIHTRMTSEKRENRKKTAYSAQLRQPIQQGEYFQRQAPSKTSAIEI